MPKLPQYLTQQSEDIILGWSMKPVNNESDLLQIPLNAICSLSSFSFSLG